MKKYLLLFFLILFLAAQNGLAQDSHYWSGHYNAGGLLSPGAAIAYTRDSGVLYINPALLAYNTKNTTTISGSLYRINSYKFKNGAGKDLPVSSLNVDFSPLMVSGVINLRGKKNLNIAYGLIYNPVINFDGTQQLDGKYNTLDDSYSPGKEQFIGQFSLSNSLNTITGILSTGMKINEKWSWGVSIQGQYLTQTYREEVNARALWNRQDLPNILPLTSSRTNYQTSRFNIGLQGVMGLSYNTGSHHLGLTFTSPMLKLMGRGRFLGDATISNLNINGDTTLNVSLLASSRQVNLKQKWKVPFSIGVGYSKDMEWGQIYVATEYFNSVKQYNIILPDGSDFFRTTSGSLNFNTESLAFQDERKSVLNFGGGIVYHLNSGISVIGALRTDYSAQTQKLKENFNGMPYNISNASITHLQLGGNYKRRKFNLRSGFIFSYGRTNNSQAFTDFSSATDQNFLLGNDTYTPARSFSVGILFAYIHNL